MELEKTKDQTSEEESKGGDNQTGTTLEVNGQDMTPEQLLESYNALQGKMTQTAQENSELKKKGTETDEVKQKAENAEKADKIRAEEEVFNTFKTDFNSLSETQLKAIRDLQSMDTGKSFEEVAKSYNFLNEAQLAKSKNGRQIMGNNIGVKTDEKETLEISTKAKRIHNIQPADKIATLRENFQI